MFCKVKPSREFASRFDEESAWGRCEEKVIFGSKPSNERLKCGRMNWVRGVGYWYQSFF